MRFVCFLLIYAILSQKLAKKRCLAKNKAKWWEQTKSKCFEGNRQSENFCLTYISDSTPIVKKLYHFEVRVVTGGRGG